MNRRLSLKSVGEGDRVCIEISSVTVAFLWETGPRWEWESGEWSGKKCIKSDCRGRNGFRMCRREGEERNQWSLSSTAQKTTEIRRPEKKLPLLKREWVKFSGMLTLRRQQNSEAMMPSAGRDFRRKLGKEFRSRDWTLEL